MGLNKNLRGEELLSGLKALETALAPFQMRPHWGKLSTFGVADYERCYGEKLDNFRAVAESMDPTGKFRNEWVRRKIFGQVFENGSPASEEAWLCDSSTIAPHTMPLTDVSAPVMDIGKDEE